MRAHWLAAALVPLVIAGAVVLPGFLDQAAIPPPSHGLVGDAVWSAGSHPAPTFTLRTWQGDAFHLASLRGRVVLLTFMDSLCTTDCPVEAAELHLMQRDLGPRITPTIVIVSTDPAGDTSTNIRKFVSKYHLGAPFDWLTGSRTQLARVWRDYDIEVTTASNHSSAVYLIDRWGDEREGWGIPFPVNEFNQSVRTLAAHYNTGWRWPWDL
jgi:cytochrome oxidase Cu insertion factor (SCO1/SenC/PrrC family)